MTLNPVASWELLAAAALTEHGMFSADEVNFAGLAAAGATLLSPFPGEGRLGVKVGLRAHAAGWLACACGAVRRVPHV